MDINKFLDKYDREIFFAIWTLNIVNGSLIIGTIIGLLI